MTLNKGKQLSSNDQLPGRASSSSSYQEQANSTLNYSTSQVVVSHNLENCLVVYSVAQAVLRGGRWRAQLVEGIQAEKLCADEKNNKKALYYKSQKPSMLYKNQE